MTRVVTWLLPPLGPSLASPKSESFALKCCRANAQSGKGLVVEGACRLVRRMAHPSIYKRLGRPEGTYRVEQDVRGLEVPVDDVLLRRVQERQPTSSADRDAQPEAPRQWLRRTSALWLHAGNENVLCQFDRQLKEKRLRSVTKNKTCN
jgi:hypothetical protein